MWTASYNKRKVTLDVYSLREVIFITILAFDQSSTKTGWAQFEDDNYISSGVINLSHIKNDSTERLLEMCDAICKHIEDIRPDLVVIEDIFDKNNVAVLALLARLQGVIMFRCFKIGIPIKILAPKTWRKIVGIKKKDRNGAKEEAVQLVNELYGLPVTNDEAEAVCIAKATCENIKKG